MPLESTKTSRQATKFRALIVGWNLRKTSASTTAPYAQDFKNAPAAITRFDKNVFSFPSPGAIPANSSIEVTVTLPDAQVPNTAVDGATESDLIVLNGPITLETGVLISGERITALNTLTFRLFNSTNAPITPATNNYQYFIVRS